MKLKMFVFFIIAILLLTHITLAAAEAAAIKPPSYNFSKLSWTEAFEELHKKFETSYAFTDWKQVDWNWLHALYLPEIENAQSNNNFDAYYVALRSYVSEIPDGHVRMDNIEAIDNKYVGAGYGFAAVETVDNGVLVTWVDEEGPAWAAGVRPQAELLEWNGEPVTKAAERVRPVFTSNSATKADLEEKKLRYLFRAAAGNTVTVTFRNTAAGKKQTVTLKAVADGGKALKKYYPETIVSSWLRDLIVGAANPAPVADAMIEKKVLPGNIGYIRIWGELDADLKDTGNLQPTTGLFRQAIQELNNQQVSSLIVDLRNNVGGLDEMSAAILGSFYKNPGFYEYQYCYDIADGKLKLNSAGAAGKEKNWQPGLCINPSKPLFSGNVIALTNLKCVSSGEGIAKGIKALPNGKTLGFYGTNGSFGIAGAEAVMPGRFIIHWPYGQSRDEKGKVQLDSRDGIGGVSPSVVVPMTAQNAMKVTAGEDVELEQAVKELIAGG